MGFSRDTPDRGWAWIVMTVSFLNQMLSGAFTYSVGIMKIAFLDEYKADPIKTDWIGSLHVAASQMSGPIISLALSRFHCRTVIIVGGLFVFVGLFSSTYVKDINLLYLTYGIISGIGQGICYTVSLVAIGYYFKKRLYLASGISTTGAGMGIMVFPPLIQQLISYYSLRGAMLILAGASLHFCAFGALVSPNKLENKSKSRNTEKRNYVISSENIGENTPSIFRNYSFDMYLISIMFWNLSYTFVAQSLPLYSNLAGYSKDEAAFLLSMAGIGSICGRLLCGAAANDPDIDSAIFYFGPTGVFGFVSLFFGTFGQSYIGQSVYAVFFGLYSGCTITVMGPIVVRLVGVEQLAVGYGTLMFFTGVGSLIGPPIGGGSFLISSFTGMLIVTLEKSRMKRSTQKLSKSNSMSIGRLSFGKTKSLYTLNDVTLEILPDQMMRYRTESNVSEISSFL